MFNANDVVVANSTGLVTLGLDEYSDLDEEDEEDVQEEEQQEEVLEGLRTLKLIEEITDTRLQLLKENHNLVNTN